MTLLVPVIVNLNQAVHNVSGPWAGITLIVVLVLLVALLIQSIRD